MRRAGHSSRGVVPSVVCLCVISKAQQRGTVGPSMVVAPQEIEKEGEDPNISHDRGG
jgi:hypothetical protein